MHRVTAKPIRRYEYDVERRCHVSRVLAYMGRCECGWKGPWRTAISDARADARGHRSTS